MPIRTSSGWGRHEPRFRAYALHRRFHFDRASADSSGSDARPGRLFFTASSAGRFKHPPAGPRSSGASASSSSATDTMPCSACHTTTGWRARGSTGDGQKFDHSTTGFPLTGEHVGTPCVGCHSGSRSIQRACVSCHEDEHRGRLSQSCDSCHSAAGWKVTRPIEIHRLTRFPLTGMHVLADCSQCHKRASEQRWTDAPVACFGCHEKEYRRPDLFPVHVGTASASPLPRDCSLCHRSVAWAPAVQLGPTIAMAVSAVREAPANHDTRFPISFGVHRALDCANCHSSQTVPRAVRCTGCHAHDSVNLMQQHRQPVATDGAACLSCHLGGARR